MSSAPDTELTLEMLQPDPMDQFTHWFEDAVARSGQNDPNAMCLSTLSPEGVPEGRIVLLKGVDPRGFVFYTNLESAKGRALAAHPVAALTFHWDRLARQVRVQGAVEPVTDEEADVYYASRPRGSRLGAWASEQSRPLVDRGTLEGRVQEMERRYPGDEIPRPPHWSGFRLLPGAVEFWQGRTSRLHDRFVYRKDSGGRWTIQRLNP
jgi:pyridoxamine 5'-phosphate oxidase